MDADKYLDLNSRRHQPGLEPAASHAYPGIELRATAEPSNSAEVSAPRPVYDYHYDHDHQQRHWPPSGNESPASSSDGNNTMGTTPASNNRSRSRQRILGLKAPVFWGALAALVLSIACVIIQVRAF
ncbi:hypothetical protein PG996_004633 [Apiospora saccharicola]|uniref:Uncharacterized protein n=1 Tax=Apiospora saccharicola TaxID=335842 RepID=A0ABR1W4M9_9PEZI